MRRRAQNAPAVVLCYHHVADVPNDALALSVHPDRFAAQLEYLRDRVDVVPLSAICHPRERPRVALTFDDGLADTIDVAEPLLSAAGLPATAFVPSVALEPGHEFWWEALVHLVLEVDQPEREALEVEIGGHPLRVDVRSAAGRSRAFRALNQRLLAVHPSSIDDVIAAVAAQLGGTVPPACSEHRKMTTDDLRAAARRDVLEIGGHTRSHALLTSLDAEAQRDEIAGNRRELEAEIGTHVSSFAYPYGYSGSFTRATAAVVRAAGYARACTTLADRVTPRSDPYRIPRHQVHDWDADGFATHLGWWLAA